MKLSHSWLESPVGKLKLVADEEKLVAVLWPKEKVGRVRLAQSEEAPNHPILKRASKELKLFFDGSLRNFSVPMEFRGTAFQKAVWKALTTIRLGETKTYRDIAMKIGNPKAVRAVGAAIGRNPISIIVPCHRVIGTNRALHGFAGGLETKRYLLEHEGLKVEKGHVK